MEQLQYYDRIPGAYICTGYQDWQILYDPIHKGQLGLEPRLLLQRGFLLGADQWIVNTQTQSIGRHCC